MHISTNSTPSMHPFLPPRGSDAIRVIQNGGLVLLPTANLWQVISDFRLTATRQRHLSLCPPTATNRPELIFSDLDLLHKWIPRLHPKLDNLLMYHRRALTILVDRPATIPIELSDSQGKVAVRLIQDSYCYRLSEDINAPLLATLAQPVGANLPLSFGQLRSDLLRSVDYVVKRRQRDQIGPAPAVCIQLNELDEIEFL
ncbi:MAG: Sua5/YciO/YrdC/YwlC family protein [Bacteroidota bacterium]